ncbi:MAG TPA: hypothetical protein VKB89_06050 [Xanthobacteraceae bacterium]|nr:hypothetical protein [Xanthobacteraceae bacterium]
MKGNRLGGEREAARAGGTDEPRQQPGAAAIGMVSVNALRYRGRLSVMTR